MQAISGFFHSDKRCCKAESVEGLDRICRIALAVFALCVNSSLFFTSFTAGLSAAIVYDLLHPSQKSSTLLPVCGQGYMEFLSKRSYPKWTVHVVTTAFIGAHIRHDPLFFVPFCGAFVGVWAGGEVVHFLRKAL